MFAHRPYAAPLKGWQIHAAVMHVFAWALTRGWQFLQPSTQINQHFLYSRLPCLLSVFKSLICSACVLCRGDVDDRMLTEAMLPLLESLADAPDVRPALHKRFGMPQ